jgi:hypothetical protein
VKEMGPNAPLRPAIQAPASCRSCQAETASATTQKRSATTMPFVVLGAMLRVSPLWSVDAHVLGLCCAGRTSLRMCRALLCSVLCVSAPPGSFVCAAGVPASNAPADGAGLISVGAFVTELQSTAATCHQEYYQKKSSAGSLSPPLRRLVSLFASC